MALTRDSNHLRIRCLHLMVGLALLTVVCPASELPADQTRQSQAAIPAFAGLDEVDPEDIATILRVAKGLKDLFGDNPATNPDIQEITSQLQQISLQLVVIEQSWTKSDSRSSIFKTTSIHASNSKPRMM